MAAHDDRRSSSRPSNPPTLVRSAGVRLKAEIWKRADDTFLALNGYIDENARLEALAAELGSPLHVDVGDVHRINSVGVRSWIEFIRRTCANGAVSLWCCPDVLVQQFGMVTTMLGSARVCSVLAPYVCDQCGHSDRHELRIPEDVDPAGGNIAPPERACTKCGKASTFDDVPDSFFMFLNQRR